MFALNSLPNFLLGLKCPPLGSILVVVGACRKFLLSIERLRRINCLLFVLKQDSLSFMQPMISNCSCIVYEYDALRCATALQHVFAAQQTLIRLLIFLQAIQKNLFTIVLKKTVHSNLFTPPKTSSFSIVKVGFRLSKCMKLLMTIRRFVYVCIIYSHQNV